MTAGRPTKYTPEMLEKAQAYVDGAYQEEGDLFPSHVGLALYLRLGKTTIYDWSNDPEKHEFSDIFDRCMAMQEKALVNNSLLGDYNSTIAKVMLTKHGYSDKQQTELTGANGGALKHEVSWTVQPLRAINETDSEG